MNPSRIAGWLARARMTLKSAPVEARLWSSARVSGSTCSSSGPTSGILAVIVLLPPGPIVREAPVASGPVDALEVLELDHQGEQEPDVGTGQDVVRGGTRGPAGRHVDDSDARV